MTIPVSRIACLFSLALPLRTLQVLAAPPSPPKNTASTATGQAYRTRVETVARDLLWANSLLLQSFERYEEALSALQKPRRNTDAASLKAESERKRAALLTDIKAVRLNATRLGALSPVPRAWKRLDDSLIESSWEWSSALESMELWLQHPSDALKNESAKHGRRAQTLLDATRRSLWVLSERSVASKNYAD